MSNSITRDFLLLPSRNPRVQEYINLRTVHSIVFNVDLEQAFPTGATITDAAGRVVHLSENDDALDDLHEWLQADTPTGGAGT